jgi:hypothetical protein
LPGGVLASILKLVVEVFLVCLNQGGDRVREKRLVERGLRTKIGDDGVETSGRDGGRKKNNFGIFLLCAGHMCVKSPWRCDVVVLEA